MTLNIPEISIESLVPHKGSMCLWQTIHAFDDAHVVVSTHSHKDTDNPLRSEHTLRSIHLCEYGAQAMAVHGGLLARAGGNARKGYLVALRGVEINVPQLETLSGEIFCEARLLMNSDSSQQYEFKLTHAGESIAEGRAAVMLEAKEQ